MTAATLEHALAAIGIPCSVEAQHRLAVLRLTPDSQKLADESVRATVVAMAKAHGFTHIALELTDVPMAGGRASAVVPGD